MGFEHIPDILWTWSNSLSFFSETSYISNIQGYIQGYIWYGFIIYGIFGIFSLDHQTTYDFYRFCLYFDIFSLFQIYLLVLGVVLGWSQEIYSILGPVRQRGREEGFSKRPQAQCSLAEIGERVFYLHGGGDTMSSTTPTAEEDTTSDDFRVQVTYCMKLFA